MMRLHSIKIELNDLTLDKKKIEEEIKLKVFNDFHVCVNNTTKIIVI